MTLTAPRVRTATRSVRSGTSSVAAPPVSPPARPVIATVLVFDGTYRVLEDGRTIGYIQLAGPIFVSLLGEVYNTSVEIAQCLDLETAVARLELARA